MPALIANAWFLGALSLQLNVGATPGVFNVRDPRFGAQGNSNGQPGNGADDTRALQSALDAAKAQGGGVVYLPAGVYRVTAPLRIYKATTLQGVGRRTSMIYADHNGDGVRSIWPVNSSTGVNINARDVGIVTNPGASRGAGFTDVGGSFLELQNVYIESFRYQVILDQSEVVRIAHSDFESLGATAMAGVWLVNGPEHTGGARSGFTNHILIEDTQFNGTPAHVSIIDDGGAKHTFRDNNFNAGRHAVWAAGAKTLSIVGNSSEGHSGTPVVIGKTTFAGGVKTVTSALTFEGNVLADTTSYHVLLSAVNGGVIRANTFAQVTRAAVNLASDLVAGIEVLGNAKLIEGQWPTGAAFFSLNGVAQRGAANELRQPAQTYVSMPISVPGRVTVTPATMGEPSTSDRIEVGQTLSCANNDGSAAEYVVVTAVTRTTFTATFAKPKSARWVLIAAPMAKKP